MKCSNCNFEVAENTKICPECGASITPATVKSTTNQPINETKKKKTKKIIIIVISVILALAVAFVVLLIINPSCMFGHRESERVATAPTCTKHGHEEIICKDCQQTLYHSGDLPNEQHLYATGHSFDKGECGVERACINCGEFVLVSHKTENGGINCIYCNKSRKPTVSIPSAPITVNEYYSSGNIKRSAMITEIEEGVTYSSGVKINFTALRMYDATNSSANVIFAWKLYASDGTVVDSGTVYSDASVAVGEKTKGSFTIYNVEDWEDYRLELTGVK